MNKKNICFSSKTIELSETKTYLELVNRVCFYDYQNLNGVLLPSDSAEDFAQTLVGMPVVAKYIEKDGKPSFGGHEAYLDDDGNISFGTSPIGVHTAVEIKDDDVDVGNGQIKNLPCLFATMKVWTRNKNAVAAVKRLFELGELHNSWELISEEYSYSNGIKTITQYTFDGNCLLGGSETGNLPAYGSSAKVISLSSKDVNKNELMVAEAFAQDIAEGNNVLNDDDKEDNGLKKNKQEISAECSETAENEVVENPVESISETDSATNPATNDENVVTDQEPDDAEKKKKCATDKKEDEDPENEKDVDNEDAKRKKCGAEVSALTDRDIRCKVEEECHKLFDRWCYVSFLLPEQHEAWVKCDYEDELAYKKVTYSVDDDKVSILTNEDVKLCVSISEINTKFSELTDALAQANNTISTLEEFKEIAEKAKKEKEIAEHNAAVEELSEYAKNAKCFSAEELESDEIKNMISELDKPALQAKIADKLVATMSAKKKDAATKSVVAPITLSSAEVASVGEDVGVNKSYRAIINDFFNK